MKFSRILAALALILLAVTAWSAESEQNRFFRALRVVECGDKQSPPDGDDGKAIGPYQIWKVYFQDACEADESIRSLKYEDCRDADAAAMVVGAYLRRYARKAWDTQDWETLARIHNGGPRGAKNPKTQKYWTKVQKAMEGK